MKIETQYKIADSLSLVIIILSSFFIGFGSHVLYVDYIQDNPFNLFAESSNSDCSNMSLQETAYCLRNELSQFYKYNLSNQGKELSLEALKQQGGVCTHYSDWYISQLKDSGFYTKQVIIWTNKSANQGHKFTIASTDNSYCLMDQEIVNCIPLASNPSSSRLKLELKTNTKEEQ